MNTSSLPEYFRSNFQELQKIIQDKEKLKKRTVDENPAISTLAQLEQVCYRNDLENLRSIAGKFTDLKVLISSYQQYLIKCKNSRYLPSFIGRFSLYFKRIQIKQLISKIEGVLPFILGTLETWQQEQEQNKIDRSNIYQNYTPFKSEARIRVEVQKAEFVRCYGLLLLAYHSLNVEEFRKNYESMNAALNSITQEIPFLNQIEQEKFNEFVQEKRNLLSIYKSKWEDATETPMVRIQKLKQEIANILQSDKVDVGLIKEKFISIQEKYSRLSPSEKKEVAWDIEVIKGDIELYEKQHEKSDFEKIYSDRAKSITKKYVSDEDETKAMQLLGLKKNYNSRDLSKAYNKAMLKTRDGTTEEIQKLNNARDDCSTALEQRSKH